MQFGQFSINFCKSLWDTFPIFGIHSARGVIIVLLTHGINIIQYSEMI